MGEDVNGSLHSLINDANFITSDYLEARIKLEALFEEYSSLAIVREEMQSQKGGIEFNIDSEIMSSPILEFNNYTFNLILASK